MGVGCVFGVSANAGNATPTKTIQKAHRLIVPMF